MYNANINEILSDLHSNPNKYLRIHINPDKAYIYLPDSQACLSIDRVMLAEFVDGQRLFFYSYDSQTSKLESGFKCVVVMKKHKGLAYVAGTQDDSLSGYVQCKPKCNDEEDDEDLDREDKETNSIFFGIVSTEHYTIVIAADNQHSKTLHVEMSRTGKNQPSLESIISTLNQLTPSVNSEVSDGQEE